VCRGGVGAIGSGDSGDGQVLGKDVGGDVWYVDGELGVWQPVKPPRVVGLAGRCSARLSARLSTNRLCRSGLRNVSRGVVILLVVIGIHPDGIVLAVGRLRHDLVQGWNRRFRTSPSRAQRVIRLTVVFRHEHFQRDVLRSSLGEHVDVRGAGSDDADSEGVVDLPGTYEAADRLILLLERPVPVLVRRSSQRARSMRARDRRGGPT